MQIKLYQNRAVLDAQTKQHLENKVQKLEKYLTNEATLAEIEIEKDKRDHFRVEVQIKSPGQHYIADSIADTIETACDQTCDEISRQIRKGKKKRQTLQKRAWLSIKKKFSIDRDARF